MQPSPASHLSSPRICMSALFSNSFFHVRGHSTDHSPGSHDSELCYKGQTTPLSLGPVGESPGGLKPSWGRGRIHRRPEPLWCWDLSSENTNHGELREPPSRSLYQLISSECLLMFPISHTQVRLSCEQPQIQGHCS